MSEAKAQAKAQAKAAREAKRQAELEAKAQSQAPKWERYNQLRANIRRRRIAYVVALVLGILVFLATVWDMVFNAAEFKWYLLPAFALIVLWEVILLFSRQRHLQEVAELEAMHRTYLECDACRSVFQFGALRLKDRRKVAFSCPVCNEDSLLPPPDASPVERVLPEANVQELTYACRNCNEQMVVGTFGSRPKDTSFEACPRCGVGGQVALA